MFPSTGNTDDKGVRNYCEKCSASLADATNSPGPLHEHRGIERSDTPVKRGHEPSTEAIVAGCVQEVDGPFRCNGGVKSFTLDPKKRNQPKQH